MKTLTNDKPDWEKIAKTAKPESGDGKVPRSTYPGCWEEGRMVGYAEAMVEFKLRFEARIASCNSLIESNPSGWPTIDLIARSIRDEFENQLKAIS